MDYEILRQDLDTTVLFCDNLGFPDQARFRTMLSEIACAPGRQVIFDFSNLEQIQAAGLGLLLIAREECARGGRTLVLRQPQGRVRRVLEAARMDRLMTVN